MSGRSPQRYKSSFLAARDLGVSKGGRSLFDRLSLDINGGEILELRGANGCGKTTLLRILAGLAGADKGTVERQGMLHYCGHADAVKPALPVRDQLRFWTQMLGAGTEQIMPALSFWKLDDMAALPGHMLSAGQKRRLALARLLLDPRPLWLLDEPFCGLDKNSEAMLNALAEEHLRRNGLIIAATHGTNFTGSKKLDIAGAATSGATRRSAEAQAQTPLPLRPALLALIKREIKLAWSGGGASTPLIFCIGCAALAPLTIGPDAMLLRNLAPGLITMILALSGLPALERLFGDDLEDGTLDVIIAIGHSTATLAAAVMIGHWIAIALPLALLAPAIWIALHGEAAAAGQIFIIAALAGIAMFALGAAAAAMTAGAGRNAVLTAILVLPLYWPVMIFSAAAMQAAQTDAQSASAMMLTAAAALFALVVSPFIAAACLRAALDS